MDKTDAVKSCKEIAAILDLSVRRVQQLAKAGHIPKSEGKNGRYKLLGSIQGYIKYLRNLSLEIDAPTDLKDAKLRVEVARAEILELDAAQKASELVHKDHVSTVWTSVTGLIKSKCLALPSRTAADVYASRNLNEVRAVLENAVDLILIELAETDITINDTSSNREFSGSEPSGDGDAKAAAKTNSKSVGR